METIIIHPADEAQEKALVTILEGLKIPYEVQDDELVKAMEEGKSEGRVSYEEFEKFEDYLKSFNKPE